MKDMITQESITSLDNENEIVGSFTRDFTLSDFDKPGWFSYVPHVTVVAALIKLQ